jgi:hypothetical protein
MRFITSAMVLGMVVGCFLSARVAIAGEACPEGRTASGECVNAGLAASMRQGSIIYSRPELSQTAQPIMPELDYTYRYPHQISTVPPDVTTIAPTFVLPTCITVTSLTSCP